MTFVRGNRAVRDYAAEGQDLLLFRKLREGLPYEGQMVYEGHHLKTAPDRTGAARLAIVFELRPLEAIEEAGLCLTGNFALAMALNPRVRAPVMGAPSLPFVGNGLRLTPDELFRLKARPDLEVRAYRYSTDRLCPATRFERHAAELGPAFHGVTIDADEKLHSVFTDNLRDAKGAFRHDKIDEVIAFLRRKLEDESPVQSFPTG